MSIFVSPSKGPELVVGKLYAFRAKVFACHAPTTGMFIGMRSKDVSTGQDWHDQEFEQAYCFSDRLGRIPGSKNTETWAYSELRFLAEVGDNMVGVSG